MKRYAISIVTHNRLELTKRCIDSILDSEGDKELLIWDNASTDGTVEYLKELQEKFEWVKVYFSVSNTGFGWGHNHNVAMARSPYFVCLNNDVVVFPSWLKRLEEAFQMDPSLAVCGFDGGCTTIGPDGTGYRGPYFDYVEGSCFMIPTVLALRHGFFSNEFRFAYSEDADLSLRFREKGFNIRTIPFKLKHDGKKTKDVVGNSLDISGYEAINHLVLTSKWKDYLEKRSFKKRILVKRMDAKGDVIWTTPVIHALKEKYGGAEIYVETNHREIFKGNPDVELWPDEIDVKDFWDFDEVIDLNDAYENKPKIPIWEAYAKAAKVTFSDTPIPRIFIDEASRKKAKAMLTWKEGSKGWIVIHPGATAWPGRNWPLENFSWLSFRLNEEGYRVVVVGDKHTPSIPCDLDLRGVLSFHETAAVIKESDGFVGIDSMPIHLAQAFLKPTVGVFGAINPTTRLLPFPFIKGITAGYERVGCLGCHHEYTPPIHSSPCIRDRVYCMERLRKEDVLKAILEAIEARKSAFPSEMKKIQERALTHIGGFPVITGNRLDIGCNLDKVYKNCIGFDSRYTGEADIVGDAARLPFPDNSQDWIFSSHCLEHLKEDSQTVLTEWVRVLRYGGMIVLYLPHRDLYKQWNPEHFHELSPEPIKEILESLGVKVDICESESGEGDRYSFFIVGEKGYPPQDWEGAKLNSVELFRLPGNPLIVIGPEKQ